VAGGVGGVLVLVVGGVGGELVVVVGVVVGALLGWDQSAISMGSYMKCQMA
jgi:hypothetical protein